MVFICILYILIEKFVVNNNNNVFMARNPYRNLQCISGHVNITGDVYLRNQEWFTKYWRQQYIYTYLQKRPRKAAFYQYSHVATEP